MSDAVKLPVEERFAALSVRMADRLRARLPRRWRENEFLLREAGLREGATIWRSPLALFLAVLTLRLVAAVIGMAALDDTWFTGDARMWVWRANRCASWVVMALAAYLCAGSLSRDRHPARREMLSLAGLRWRQLIDAKLRLWLFPLLIANILPVVAFWAVCSVLPVGWSLAHLGGSFLSEFMHVGARCVFVVILSARLASAPLSASLSAGIAVALLLGVEMVPFWRIPSLLAGPTAGLALFLLLAAVELFEALILLIPALLLWRGLRRRLAEAYCLSG